MFPFKHLYAGPTLNSTPSDGKRLLPVNFIPCDANIFFQPARNKKQVRTLYHYKGREPSRLKMKGDP